jgi:hypothetical protein
MMDASCVTMRQRIWICAEVLLAAAVLLPAVAAVDDALVEVWGAAVTAGLEAFELGATDTL